MSNFEAGLDTRSVTSGWIATVRHEDGSSTDYWAPTEKRARAKAQKEGEDDE
jgi:hypothetical protein